MKQRVLDTFERSLERCETDPAFLDLFYESFLGSSSKVRERFANTDMDRQKKALRSSFALLLQAAREDQPERYLKELAESHGSDHLNIGAELYDLWLDSLLEAVGRCDGLVSSEVLSAWEQVMAVGVRYLLSHYHHSPP